MMLVACCSPEAMQATARAAATCTASCNCQGARADLMREVIVSCVVLVVCGSPGGLVQGTARAATPCTAVCVRRGARGQSDAYSHGHVACYSGVALRQDSCRMAPDDRDWHLSCNPAACFQKGGIAACAMLYPVGEAASEASGRSMPMVSSATCLAVQSHTVPALPCGMEHRLLRVLT